MARNFFRVYEGIGLKPRSTDPTSPVEGDLFFSNGTPRAKGLWEYKNSAWVQLDDTGNTPNFNLDIEAQSTSFTAAAGKTYLVSTSGGAVTVTMPAAALNAFVRIKDSAGAVDTNAITINTPGAETIDGAASETIDSNYQSMTLVSDGTNWFKL